MKHLSCPISGVLPKDEASGQLQASTHSAMRTDLGTGVKDFLVYQTALVFHFLNHSIKFSTAARDEKDRLLAFIHLLFLKPLSGSHYIAGFC